MAEIRPFLAVEPGQGEYCGGHGLGISRRDGETGPRFLDDSGGVTRDCPDDWPTRGEVGLQPWRGACCAAAARP